VKPVPETGRRGEPTIRINDRYLHSPYSPTAEARRFLDGYGIPEDARTLVVIGDGLGLLVAELSARRPDLRVVSIEPVSSRDSLETRYSAVTEDRLPAADATEQSVRRWLRGMLHPTEIGGVHLLLWPGIDRCAADWRGAIERGVRDGLRDLRSELATVAHFGRLWITNAIRATLGTDHRSEVTLQGDTLYLAAAGPTVSTLPGGVRPLAVSSALRALHYREIEPLLVLHTDAGAWGRRYLIDVYSFSDALPVLPLRAGEAPAEAPLLISDGSLVDQLAPDAESWLRMPDQPSVGAQLVDLATRLGNASAICCAGFDLCSYDLLLHGRPHRNDRYITARSHRLFGDTTQRFARVLPGDRTVLFWDDGAPAYVSDALEAFIAPIRQILERETAPSIQPVSASPAWTEYALRRGLSVTPRCGGTTPRLIRRSVKRPNRDSRRRQAITTISRWRDLIQTGPDQNRERRDLLLYLAPVEYLTDLREASYTAAAVAQNALDRIVIKAGLT